MVVIGIAGGIATGKTEVAKLLVNRGAIIISGDELGREVIQENPGVLRELVEAFSEEILDENGKLNRRKLAQLAFRDPVSKKKLNNIIHPHLLRRLKERLTQLRKKEGEKLVVVDAALIPDWGIKNWLDYLVIVDCTYENQLQRLKERGLSEQEAKDRIASQLSSERKRESADYLIENNGTLEELRQESEKLYLLIQERFSKTGVDKKR
ncbi:MAG: dephospho-CoA kinase [Candidatus Zixiibacteriota bacterium]